MKKRIHNEILRELKRDFNHLIKSSLIEWNYVRQKKNIGGIYVIYNKKKIVYIGSTNKFSVRFGIDLLHKSTHTLHKKLLKEKGNPEKVKKFLKEKCKYKIKEENDLRKRELLEHYAIVVLEPMYNKK